MKNKKINFKKKLLLTASSVPLLMGSFNASAQLAVADAPLLAQQAVNHVITTGQLTTANTELHAILSLLITNFSSTGLAQGVVPELLSLQIQALKQIDANNTESVKNLSNAMGNMQKIEMAANDEQSRMPDVYGNSCAELSYTAARSGGVSSTSGAAKIANVKENLKRENAKSSDEGVYTKAVNNAVNGFCSPREIENNIGACRYASQASRKMPNADISAGSLFKGAGLVTEPTNSSLDKEQQMAAAAYASNVSVGKYPQKIDIGSLGSSATYTTRMARYDDAADMYTARADAAFNSLNQIQAFSSAPTQEERPKLYSQQKDRWNKLTDPGKYNDIFPGEKYPEVPSEREILRYDVVSEYSDFSKTGKISESGSMKGKDAATQMVVLQIKANYINYLRLQRQEEANVMLAALVGQSLNEVQYDRLKQEADAIGISASGLINQNNN